MHAQIRNGSTWPPLFVLCCEASILQLRLLQGSCQCPGGFAIEGAHPTSLFARHVVQQLQGFNLVTHSTQNSYSFTTMVEQLAATAHHGPFRTGSQIIWTRSKSKNRVVNHADAMPSKNQELY